MKSLKQMFCVGIYSNKIPKKPYDVKVAFHVTKHAVKRMNERGITKGQLQYNLTEKPLYLSDYKLDDKGRPSYSKYSDNLLNVRINPLNHNIPTVNSFSKDKYDKIKNKGEEKWKNINLKQKG
jgi:predicted HicB family RNase H-like nuclease